MFKHRVGAPGAPTSDPSFVAILARRWTIYPDRGGDKSSYTEKWIQ